MNKKMTILFVSLLFTSLFSKELKGLNVLLTEKNTQTQLMAMVLSVKTLENKAKVNILLCSEAGDLAIKSIKSTKLKPLDVSPKMLLQKLIKKGAKVQVCPLYLPNTKFTKNDLLDGISIANPKLVSKQLLNKEFETLSY